METTRTYPVLGFGPFHADRLDELTNEHICHLLVKHRQHPGKSALTPDQAAMLKEIIS